jgi:hypothetical protein
MNHQQVIQISKANNSLATLDSLNIRFLKHCADNATPQDLPTKLEINGHTISINAFGSTVSATGRHVRFEADEFSTEYVFSIKVDEQNVEIWRCYLTSNGKLVKDLAAQSVICDFDNHYVAKHLCGNAMLGVLQSKAFLPTANVGC